MKKLKIQKKLLDKRIPTIIGMVVLVVSLIAGTVLIGKGGGVFAPRASVETTPKKIKVTNVNDTSFTISFITDSPTVGFVKYGTENGDLNSQASNDKDQISGNVGNFQTHHITVRGLQQDTNYYYGIGTGSGNIFDDNGQSFNIKTTSRSGIPAAAKTIYGSVTNTAGAPAEGTIVYVNINGAGPMSSQVKASGSWYIPLSNARTTDGTTYAVINDEDNVTINIQGPLSSETASLTTTVNNSQPVEAITFGQVSMDNSTPTTSPAILPPTQKQAPPIDEDENTEIDATISADTTNDYESTQEDVERSSREAALKSLLGDDIESSDSATATDSSKLSDTDMDETIIEVIEVDLDSTNHQTVTTSNPVIIGKAPPNITISISVHSDTEIEKSITVDENGEFVLDISQLSESLEPGEHTVSYSYSDPDTGELIEKVVNFTVSDSVSQIANAENLSAPYGSGNPYPPETPTPTPEVASESAIASESATATPEARTALPATDEAVPVSGSVGTTLALVFGGIFFIISGLWSFWISTQLDKEEIVI